MNAGLTTSHKRIFRKTDKRKINAIRNLIREHRILGRRDTDQLAYDLGDLMFSTLAYRMHVGFVEKTLKEFKNKPESAQLQLGYLHVELAHMRFHQRTAHRLVGLALRNIAKELQERSRMKKRQAVPKKGK